MIIDGKEIAQNIYNELKEEINTLKKKPSLGAVLVGDNSSSLRYIKQKQKWADYTGINFELKKLDENISEEQLLEVVYSLNNDDNIDGYIVQLPLPEHIDSNKIINAIDPEKDVDGFHTQNQGKILIGETDGFVPCTPAGIVKILKNIKMEVAGKIVTVIGKSNIVGKPITALLINAGATVISCNSKTPSIKDFTLQSDIVVVAAGRPGLLTADMVNKNTTVIDVGFTVIDGKIYGDALCDEIEEKGCSITPVPGGVGALTVAMLMSNTLKAYKIKGSQQNYIRK